MRFCVVIAAVAAIAGPAPRSVVGDRVATLTRSSSWTRVAAVPIGFRTFHPQGMVKIGETLYVSSVDIKTPTKRFAQPQDGFDRDTGEGAGHPVPQQRSPAWHRDYAVCPGLRRNALSQRL